MPTRKDKLAAMAAQTESPAEAAVAATKLANMPESTLEAIVRDINEEFGKGVESSFAIGRLLIKARDLLTQDIAFGKWFKEQDLPFGLRTAQRLRWAAENEKAVRALIGTTSKSDREVGVVTAVQLLTAPAKHKAADVGETAPVDPAYSALRNAFNVILAPNMDGEPQSNAFLGMHVEDLAKSAGFIKALAKAYNEAKTAVESK